MGKKIFRKNILKKKFWEKNLKKNVGKINSKTKIFITKLYSNIDKCHNIFALLAPFDKTGRKTGSNENVCGIWFKIGSVARSHRMQGMRRFERSREKIVHYDTSAMKRFLTSVNLQHEPKASDVITLVKKTFFRTSIVRNFISRVVKMQISAREACVKPHLRTRSNIKYISWLASCQ